MKRRVVLLTCALFLLSLGCPASVFGAEWILPVDGASIDTPFGVPCIGGVHRGIDLAAPASCVVRAPAAGRILFAGTVPADGGGTCMAVTIEIAEGVRVSLLPLEALHVSAGGMVRAGETVGRLAPTGDDSMTAPHLHLGLREGDAYRDPAPMLPAQAVGGGDPVSAGESAGATTPETPSAAPPAEVPAMPAAVPGGEPAVVIMGAHEAPAHTAAAVDSRSPSSVSIASTVDTPMDAIADDAGSAVLGRAGSSARLIEDAGVRSAAAAGVAMRQSRASRGAEGGSIWTASVPGIPSATSTAVGCVLALGVALLARSKVFVCVR